MVATIGNEKGVYSPKIKQLKDKKVWLKRDLLDWYWKLNIDKTITLYDKKTNHSITLDKVRLMSFMKFAVSALDKMRIEENKKLRNRISKIKSDYKQKINILHDKRKQQILSAKARKIK